MTVWEFLDAHFLGVCALVLLLRILGVLGRLALDR